jgi:tRNA-specific 2-thiouridylase
LERALALDADYLATGHYARVCHTDNGYELRKAVDASKDQSYVLHVLGQKELAQVLFPVGDYEKVTIREMARKFNLPVAQKSESMDLCFLGDGDYRRFLNEYAPNTTTPGPILNQGGEELGRHTGLPNYTIGQRKGLGIAAGEPMFVLQKDITRNALIVGTRAETDQYTLLARQVNWTIANQPTGPVDAEVKVRYKARAIPAVVTPLENNEATVTLKEPVFGITAGQGAVFYDGDVVIGGGIIAMAETAVTEPG